MAAFAFLIPLILLALATPADANHVAATGNEEAICTRAEVIFCDNYEDRATGAFTNPGTANVHTYKNNGYIPSWSGSNGNIAVTASPVFQGTKALALTTPTGQPSGGFMDMNFSTYPTTYRTIYIRWYWRYSTNWTWSPIAVKGWGPTLPRQTNVIWGYAGGTNGLPHFATVVPNIQYYEQNVGGPAVRMANDTWYCMEARLTAATAGQSNGVVEGWIDGVKKVSYSNVPFDVGETYYGALIVTYWNCTSSGTLCSEGVDHPTMTQYRDNMVVSTAPIGCSGSAPTADAVNPAGSIVSPAAAATLTAPTTTFTVSASDAGSGVLHVRPLIGAANFPSGSGCDALLTAPSTGTTAAGTWSCTMLNSVLGNGAKSLTATITDAAGNTLTTAAVSVTVTTTQVDPASPVAVWPLTTDGSDTSGNGLTLTFSGGAAITGSVLVMDGVDDKADQTSTLLNMTTAFSIAGWIVPQGTGWQRLYEHGGQSAAPTCEYCLVITGTNKLQIELSPGGTLVTVASNDALTIGARAHVAATWNGTTAKLYINGTEQASLAASGTISAINNVTAIGYRNVSGGAQFYNGTLSDFRVWSRALSASEVSGLLGNVISSPNPCVAGQPCQYGDTTLNLDRLNHAAEQDLKLYIWQAGKWSNVALIRQPVTNVPAAATVSTCTLTLHMLQTARVSGTVNVTLHKVTGLTPVVGAATGQSSDGQTGWAASTGTGDGSGAYPLGMGDIGAAVVTLDVGTTAGPKTFAHADLTAACQDWVTTEANNKGLILRLDSANPIDSYVSFASLDHPDPAIRPILTITTTSTEQPTTTRSVKLRWTDASQNEDGFILQRKTGAGGTYAVIATLPENVTQYLDTGLVAATTYFYRVASFVRTEGGEVASAFSTEASILTPAALPLPEAPKARSPIIRGDTTLTVSWGDASNNEDGFKVERSIGAGAFVQIATTAANVTSSTDGSALNAPATVFQFDDSAGTYVDETADCASVATGDCTPFPAVEGAADRIYIGFPVQFASADITMGTAGVGGTMDWKYWTGSAWAARANVNDSTSGLLATAGTTTRVTWDSPTDEAALVINDSESLYWLAGEVTGVYSTNPVISQITVSGLLDGITYCYQVRAFNATGNSAYTPQVCGQTIAAPTAPSGLVLE